MKIHLILIVNQQKVMKNKYFENSSNSYSKATKNDEKRNILKIHLILIVNQQKMMKRQIF